MDRCIGNGVKFGPQGSGKFEYAVHSVCYVQDHRLISFCGDNSNCYHVFLQSRQEGTYLKR